MGRGPARNPHQYSQKWQRVLVKKKKRRAPRGGTMELYKDIADGCAHFWGNRIRAEFLKSKNTP